MSAHDGMLRRVAFYLFIISLAELGILGLLALQGIKAPDILMGGLLTQLGGCTGALGALLVKGGTEGPQEVVTPPDTPLDVTPVEEP